MIQKLGLVKPVESADKGRYERTKNEGDTLMFKVPQLLNVEKTAPYNHDGSIATLEEVVVYIGGAPGPGFPEALRRGGRRNRCVSAGADRHAAEVEVGCRERTEIRGSRERCVAADSLFPR